MNKETLEIKNEKGRVISCDAEDFRFRIDELLVMLEETPRESVDYKDLRNQLLEVYFSYCFFVRYYEMEQNDFIEEFKNDILIHRLQESSENLQNLAKILS